MADERIRKLREEHAEFAQVLDALRQQLAAYGERGRIDREAIAKLLDYCRGFPALCHHPRENLVYRKLRAVADRAVRDAVSGLQLEHAELESLTDDLEAAIDAVPPERGASRQNFVLVACEFLNHCRRHMEREEAILFPAAERGLSDEDWADIDRQAAGEAGRRFGIGYERRFHALHDEILGTRGPGGHAGGNRRGPSTRGAKPAARAYR